MKTIRKLKMLLVLALLGWASVANAQTYNWSGTVDPGALVDWGGKTVNITGNVTLSDHIVVSSGTLTINAKGNYTITISVNENMIVVYNNAKVVVNGGNYTLTFLNTFDESVPIITSDFVSQAWIECYNCNFTATNSRSGGSCIGSNGSGQCILRNCKFLNTNTNQFASAVYCLGVDLDMTDCEFTNNNCSGASAGALMIESLNMGGTYSRPTATIERCSFTNNKVVRWGGAVYSSDAELHFTDCSFSNNQSTTAYATSAGGAVYLDGDVDATFTDCSFTSNQAPIQGGALFISGSTVMFENCTMENNKTTIANTNYGWGGAIYCDDSQVEMVDCTLNNGNTSNYGGAICNDYTDSDDMLTLRNTTITGNKANVVGGGIYKVADVTVEGLMNISGNTVGTSTVSNVYVFNYSGPHQYVFIDTEGLECGSIIGITKRSTEHTYDNDDVFGGVRTPIANGTQANCDFAFHNQLFFDDTDIYHVHNLVQGSTNPYANAYLYFIDTWNTYTPDATINVDYKAAGGFVTEVMTAKGLAYFAWDVNTNHDYTGKTVKQTTDIDLADHYWEPIGIKAYGDCIDTYMPFKGTYDGQGYVIRNVHSILPYDALGLFGYVDGGTITRTFVESGALEATGSRTVGIGGLVGRLLNGATVTYSEARVSITKTATATMGGLVGLVDGNSNIHSSMTMSSLSNNGVTGGLVGQMTAGSTLKNSFSNDVYTLADSPYAGGIVGVNAGTVANCYANDTRNANSIAGTVKFGWLAGQNTGTFQYCYAPNNTYDYTAATGGTNTEPGHFTAAESLNGKYKYNQYDQKVTDGGTTHKPTVGKVNLLGYLNHWVSGDYASWTRTLSSPINTDYPVPMLPTFACAGSTDGIFIWYSPTLDAMTTRYNALDGGGSVYLYSAQEDVSVNNDSDVNIYIGENIGITQTDANTLQSAHVGITLDNSDGSNLGGQNYDWHMFATPLSNASMGLTYSAEYLGVDNSTWGNDGVYPVDPPAGSVIIGTNSYFPTDTPYGPPYTQINADGGGYDFYCFSEPYYHWVNFKRHSGDHWHQDSQDHVHASLPYGDYNASGTWTNGNETVMIPAKGYIMAVDKETTLINSGTLNNGTVSRKITHSNDLPDYAERLSGCNLIGNPYQSYLNFDAFAGTNGINTYYILDADEHEYVAYTVGQTEVYTGDDMTMPRFIHPHQGFFVKAAADKTLTFDNTMRSVRGKANSYFRDEERPVYPLVTLTVADAEGQRDYVTIELDRPEQGGGEKAKGLHTGKGIIYCHLGDVDYHVAFTESGIESIPVRFEAFEDDVFTMRWGTMNADFSYLHLIDNLTGSDVDCLSSSEYHFEGRTTDYASRFQLLFEFTGVDENDEDGLSNSSETFAFLMGDELIVNGGGVLQLFDLNGRTLMSKRIEGTQSSLGMARLNPGVYVLQLVNGNNSRTQKLVINK